METKLTLNDGTEIQLGSAILSGNLFLYIRGEDLRTVFDQLIDPEKTKKITYTEINGEETEYRRYDKLIAVRDEGNGLITAVLRREVND